MLLLKGRGLKIYGSVVSYNSIPNVLSFISINKLTQKYVRTFTYGIHTYNKMC